MHAIETAHRPISLFGLSFLAGLLGVQQLPTLPDLPWLIVCLLVLVLAVFRRYYLSAAFMAGFVWACLVAALRLSDQLPADLEGVQLPVSGRVTNLPDHDGKRVRFDFLVNESQEGLPKKIRLTWYYPDQIVAAGQLWRFTVKLKRPHGSYNPAGFDYERWLFADGIGALGYIRPAPKPVLLGTVSAWCHPSIWRQWVSDQLTGLLPHSQNLALIKALTIGDGSQISQSQWLVLRNTGTTHLMVISGSHIALVAGLVYLLVLKCWARLGCLSWSPQVVAACVALSAGIFYAGLAGFTVPTQRAAMMLGIAMAAIIMQRHTRPFNVLVLAMFSVLVWDPLAVLSVGYWLSFGAVALIIYVSAHRLGRPGLGHEAWHINWVTALGLTPLLLIFFQQVSLVSPLANVFAVPVISFLIVPLALLAVVVMLVTPVLAQQLFWVVDLSLQGLWWLLAHLAEIPLAVFNHPAPPLWTLCLVLPGLLLLLAPKGLPSRWMGLVLCLPVFFIGSTKPPTGGLRLSLLDVGQGLSVVVQTAKHCLVFDTGGKFSEDNDMGRTVLLPFLQAQGLNRIDQLIISHGDNDHVGGVQSLLSNITADSILTSVPEQFSQYSPKPCQAGQSWQWDGVGFTILSPAHAFSSDNNNSCVLKIQTPGHSVLLSADIEADAENWLVAQIGKELQADVLIAPHHGSKTSSTWPFLQKVRPAYVLIPAGYRNQFGHPHEQVLARYAQIHAQWLSSADHGAIDVNINANGLTVDSLRARTGKYWNNKPGINHFNFKHEYGKWLNLQ